MTTGKLFLLTLHLAHKITKSKEESIISVLNVCLSPLLCPNCCLTRKSHINHLWSEALLTDFQHPPSTLKAQRYTFSQVELQEKQCLAEQTSLSYEYHSPWRMHPGVSLGTPHPSLKQDVSDNLG